MKLTINGREAEHPDGMTVAGLVEAMGLSGRRVAVERNREIVKREDHARTALEEGDVLEVLHFVGGGRG